MSLIRSFIGDTHHEDTHLVLPENLTFAEWEDKGRIYQTMVRSSQWWAADWALYGKRHFGQQYAQAIAPDLGLSIKTIQNAVWVAEKFPPARRRMGLEFAHHAEVAGLSEPEQEEAMDLAESNGWTRADLRKHLHERRQLPPPEQTPCADGKHDWETHEVCRYCSVVKP